MDLTVHEQHYTIGQIAERWGLSTEMVRQLFKDEKGVVIFTKHQPHRRIYQTYRIPESVVERVYRKNLSDNVLR